MATDDNTSGTLPPPWTPEVGGLSAAAAARLADDAEAAAYADLYDAAPPDLRQALGLRVEWRDGITALVAPGLPTPMFNRAIGLGMAHPATQDDVGWLQRLYRDAGVGPWWLHRNPHALPDDFLARLRVAGYADARRRSWAKVLRGTAPAPAVASDLAVDEPARARWDETAACIAQVFGLPPPAAGWLAALHGRPRWRVYAAADGGHVVGGACMYVDGGVAWLGMGSVLESHRRRGGQRALMARRIADAIAAGCTAITTETGEPAAGEPNPSLANMARCGFGVVASRLNLQAPA